MATLSLKNDAVTEVAQLLIDQVGTDEVATSKITLGAAGVDDGFVSTANPLPVSVASIPSHAVTNAGTFAVQESGGALTALQLIDDAVYTDGTGTPSKGIAVMGTDGTNPQIISTNTTGHVNIADGGNAITVDNGGTFAVQAAQSGTWNVTNVSGTVSLPTGAATLAEQQTQTTALQLIDDAIYVDDIPFTAGANKVMAAGFRYDDVTPDAVQQGDVGYARMSSRRELYATIRDAAGNERGLNVDANGAIGVTDSSGSLTVDAPVGTPVFVRLSDGAAAITTLPVSLASVPSHAVTNAGTFAVQAASAGDVAHDSADSGNPVKVGAKAETALSGVTLVSDGDRTDLHAGVDGVLITRPHCNLEDIVSGNASNTDGTSTQCIAAQAAGVKTYLTSIILTNTSSSNTYVEIKDGTTAKLTIPVPANGGAVCNLPVPLGGTAATAWNFDPGAATTTMYCSMVGFKSKV